MKSREYKYHFRRRNFMDDVHFLESKGLVIHTVDSSRTIAGKIIVSLSNYGMVVSHHVEGLGNPEWLKEIMDEINKARKGTLPAEFGWQSIKP